MPGIDQSIIVPARRLHFTLGVMSLVDQSDRRVQPGTGGNPSRNVQRGKESSTLSASATGDAPPLTVKDAIALLRGLAPTIRELLGSKPFRIPLERMDIMKPDRGNPHKAHVLWVGPSMDSPEGIQLKKACGKFRLIKSRVKFKFLIQSRCYTGYV